MAWRLISCDFKLPNGDTNRFPQVTDFNKSLTQASNIFKTVDIEIAWEYGGADFIQGISVYRPSGISFDLYGVVMPMDVKFKGKQLYSLPRSVLLVGTNTFYIGPTTTNGYANPSNQNAVVALLREVSYKKLSPESSWFRDAVYFSHKDTSWEKIALTPTSPDVVGNVIAHELGHVWGLPHCTESGCLMGPSVKPSFKAGCAAIIREKSRKGIPALITSYYTTTSFLANGFEEREVEEYYFPGDIDRDGLVTDEDVAKIKQYVAEGKFNREADVNQDKKVTIIDAILAAQYLAGTRRLFWKE